MLNCEKNKLVGFLIVFISGIMSGMLLSKFTEHYSHHKIETNPIGNGKNTFNYKDLYYSRLVDDLTFYATAIHKVKNGEYSVVSQVMSIRLNSGLKQIDMETNYPWSEWEINGIKFVRDHNEGSHQ